jgi:predicted LPLAT superfamily acyltransferase
VKSPDWLARPEVGNDFWLRVMLWIATTLGRPVSRLLLWPIAAFFWLRTPDVRADSAKYLSKIFDRPATALETLKHYYVFSATILDRIYFLKRGEGQFEIEIVGEEHLLELLAPDQGVFLVGAHLGSIEVLRHIGLNRAGRGVAMAMFESNAQTIGKFLRRVDPELADNIVPLGRPDSMLRLSERIDSGDMVGFLADRSFGEEPTQSVQFCGESAPFPTGVFRMASALRCPVIGMAGLYMGGNRYQVHFSPLADFSNIDRSERKAKVHDAIDSYGAHLEKFCRIAPYNWFNFYDFWSEPASGEQSAQSPEAPVHKHTEHATNPQ